MDNSLWVTYKRTTKPVISLLICKSHCNCNVWKLSILVFSAQMQHFWSKSVNDFPLDYLCPCKISAKIIHISCNSSSFVSPTRKPWRISSFPRLVCVATYPDSKVHGAKLGPTGPRWAPCWPHELCYLGIYALVWMNVCGQNICDITFQWCVCDSKINKDRNHTFAHVLL